jgi:V/A-type H+/Na+-transporting ATPase subunit D
MDKLKLSKSAQNKEKTQLKLFRQYLPSLDLKRQQLMMERAKAQQTVQQTQAKIEQLQAQVGQHLPMLANEQIDLDGLVSVQDLQIGEQNLVGVRLPVLTRVQLARKAYSLMAKPFWVDATAALLAELLPLQVQKQVDERRLQLLDQAVRTVTQRVNLFDKVLIPKAEQNIKRIQIYLSDMERSAVVRAKIAKQKQAAELNS